MDGEQVFTRLQKGEEVASIKILKGSRNSVVGGLDSRGVPVQIGRSKVTNYFRAVEVGDETVITSGLQGHEVPARKVFSINVELDANVAGGAPFHLRIHVDIDVGVITIASLVTYSVTA